MFPVYVIITVVTILANAWATAADLTQARFVLATMDEVAVPRSWLPPLGILKGAGAAGLLLGLLGVRPLGIAAAVGLALFFAGALAAHARARVFHNIAVPGAYLALAVASAALAAAVRLRPLPGEGGRRVLSPGQPRGSDVVRASARPCPRCAGSTWP